MAMSSAYSHAELKMIKELTEQGSSSREIAEQLNFNFPTQPRRTRNSVIGLAYRKGWKLLASNKRPKKDKPLPIVAESKLPPVIMLFPNYIETTPHHGYGPRVLLDAQQDHCRWIAGDPKSMLICGYRADSGRIYCRDHLIKVYQKVA